MPFQAWERLEKAEHERELALRTELIRQEKLEQLARRFDRKAAMRETWLSENQRLVSQVVLPAAPPDGHGTNASITTGCGLWSLADLLVSSVLMQDNFGFDLQAVEAATKKHEAIETDIAAYEERVQVSHAGASPGF